MPQASFEKKLQEIPGLADLVNTYHRDQDQDTKILLAEFALHGLAEYSLLSKHSLSAGLQFKDLLSGMFTLPRPDEDEEEDDDENESSRGML